jgi:hypothetical protein
MIGSRCRQQRKPDYLDADTHQLQARAGQDIVSNGNQTALMQIRTSCEHKRVKISSATETRPPWCRYAPTASTSVSRYRQQRKPDRLDADTHGLRARAGQDIVSNGNQTALVQIRTNCEHERVKISSATETRPP